MAFKKARHPKQDPKKRNKIQALFWMDPPQATRIKKLAEKHEISQSELVRAVFTHMDEHKLWDGLADRLHQQKVNRAAAAASEAA